MKNLMKILIAYDDSECASAAIEDLKRAGLPQKAEAHILSVYAEWMPVPASYGMVETGFVKYVEKWEKDSLAMARRARAVVKSLFPDWEVQAEAATGSPANLIVDRADELKADLIVVGSHGRSAIGRMLLGSVSQKVLNAAHTAVRISRGRLDKSADPIRLIVGIDGSKGAEAAVNAVAERHWPQGSEARLVNGIPILPSITTEYGAVELMEWLSAEKGRVKEIIDKEIGKLKGAGLKVSTIMKEEDARQLLISEATNWGADCIFIGARGMGAFERFVLGSVSSFVASHAHCSVEVIRD